MAEPKLLRRASSIDAPAIRDLSRLAYAKWVPLIGREPIPMTADYDRAVADHIIDLWEEEGQLLAIIEMVPSGNHLLIENIAVRPDRLLKHAEDLALSLGFAETQLYTNAAFASNLAFYSRRGYQEIRRGTIVPGSVTIFMNKKLVSTG